MTSIPTPTELVEAHTEYARHLCYKIKGKVNSNLDVQDLEGAALEGLCKAAKKYNNLNVPFVSFAYSYIMGAVMDFIRAESVSKGWNRARGTYSARRKDGKIVPISVVSISTPLHVKDDKARELTFEDVLVDESDPALIYEAKETCHELWSRLTPRQKQVGFLKALGYSSREIALMLGVSVTMVDVHRYKAYARTAA